MKLSTLLLAVTLVFGSLATAQAACTPEEAQSKANAFSQAMQTKSQSDPQGAATIMQELQPKLVELQQKQDMNALCEFYDAALDKLK